MAYTRTKIEDLVEGKIDPDTLHQMLSTPKDPERFATYVEILQERVPWDDKIILPLGPKLYIVQQKVTKTWVVRCECGHDFCGWQENWKLHARIHVRDTPAKLEEIYPRLMAPTPTWQVIREYVCGECGTLHDVEAPTPWYPVIRDFEPDIDAFYSEWLGLPVPERAEG
ncbi:acetone carboxylase subunit gamma [Xanthobacter agilis]|jgi:acetone carboxylase gamma subunit|uniref:Acetone carboxylase gamma subunit n=1 Tax=Xanthobacter agilis TaxID=47492 RepID=A0ABU0L8B6_XANAG|nr:acetone carboxylase subunit gamma [Xanthobacter agilis]MDQ0503343.1 acetone carboxylase gamma subunit [Xanthobacter agilis]